MNVKTFSEQIGADAGVDPVTLITVVYMIVSIVKFVVECRNSHRDIVSTAKNPGPFDKLIIQAKIRRRLKGEAYNKYGKKIMEAIFRRAATLTEADFRDIVKEVQSS